MLVELGIDRFNADISHRFIKDSLVSNSADLAPYLLHSSAPLEDRIKQLVRMHLALQSMLMLEKFVQFAPYGKLTMAK